MNSQNIFVLFASLFALSQASTLDKDAEIVPEKGNRSSGADIDDPVIIVNLSPSPFRPMFGDVDPISRLFNRIFRSSFPFPPTETDILSIPSYSPESSLNTDFDGPNLRDLLFNFPSARFPDLSSYPDNYDNSTHEVQVVNGTKIEVNRTISKSKGNNGVFVQEVQIIRYSPEGEDSEASDVPEEVPTEIETKDPSANTPEDSANDNAADKSKSDADTSKFDKEETNPEKPFEDFGPN